MKIIDIINQDRPTLSFEVFPPKKDTDFVDVEAAACSIAAYKPDYMSVYLYQRSEQVEPGRCARMRGRYEDPGREIS